MIAYVDETNKKGLAIALNDEAGGNMNWNTASGENGAAAHTPAITGQTWKLPSVDEWQQMLTATWNEDDEDYDYYYTNLNSIITTAGGTAFANNDQCWTSFSYYDAGYNHGQYLKFSRNGKCQFNLCYQDDDFSYHVRAVLAFDIIDAPAAEPGKYTVTMAADAGEGWTIAPAEATTTGVDKDTEITDTYSEERHVKSVTAVVKAAAPAYTLLSAATAEDIGKVVCAAGHLHDAKTAVPDGCTAVGILGKVTETGHGLILALQDATSQTWNTINGWTSVTTFASTTLKVLPDDAARGSLTSYTTLGETTVSNWAVAQKNDYEAIFINLGSTTGNKDGCTYDANVNDFITTGVGGTAISGTYWSATASGSNYARYFGSSWGSDKKMSSNSVRPVLGFYPPLARVNAIKCSAAGGPQRPKVSC